MKRKEDGQGKQHVGGQPCNTTSAYSPGSIYEQPNPKGAGSLSPVGR